jgi:hypothetical protein
MFITVIETCVYTLPLQLTGGISAASFCCQVAAWFPDMFCNYYLVKNQKIVKNSTTTKTREKFSTDLES